MLTLQREYPSRRDDRRVWVGNELESFRFGLVKVLAA